jgi:hypothetical protein
LHTAPHSISQTFIIAPAARELAEPVLSAIDAVHGLGSLTRLNFDRTDLPFDWQGQFDPYTRTVTVATTARFPLLSGIHEIGHVLDAIFLVHAGGLGRIQGPITRYASEYGSGFSRGPLFDWFDAVLKTRPLHELRAARQAMNFGSDVYEIAQYYLDAKEIWARSYEQFIAQKTDNRAVRSEFREKRLLTRQIGDAEIRVYWTHSEFAPIAQEIEAVFRMIGWM